MLEVVDEEYDDACTNKYMKTSAQAIFYVDRFGYCAKTGEVFDDEWYSAMDVSFAEDKKLLLVELSKHYYSYDISYGPIIINSDKSQTYSVTNIIPK